MFRVKKDEVLKRNLLKRLYGAEEEKEETKTAPKSEKKCTPVPQQSQTRDVSNISSQLEYFSNRRVYGAAPAPADYTPISDVDVTFDPGEQHITDSDSSEDCNQVKRRRKRHRKRKLIDDHGVKIKHSDFANEKTEQNVTSDNDRLKAFDCKSCDKNLTSSGTPQVPVGIPADGIPPSDDVVVSLSKNQKRKLKKKRRKLKGRNSTEDQEPFVYIDKKEEQCVVDEQKNREITLHVTSERLADVKDFLDAIWDIYIKEEEFHSRSVAEKVELKRKFDTWMDNGKCNEEESYISIVEELYQIKSVSILKDSEQIKTLLEKLQNHSRCVDHDKGEQSMYAFTVMGRKNGQFLLRDDILLVLKHCKVNTTFLPCLEGIKGKAGLRYQTQNVNPTGFFHSAAVEYKDYSVIMLNGKSLYAIMRVALEPKLIM